MANANAYSLHSKHYSSLVKGVMLNGLMVFEAYFLPDKIYLSPISIVARDERFRHERTNTNERTQTQNGILARE